MVKVVVLGLDGATWKVLNPLIKAGLLPHFRRMMKNGSSASLISTNPPITSPAWPSMATGLNPGKLGVYSTLKRSKSNVFSLKPISSSVYKGKAVWDFLSENNIHVALFKVPFLYPVYKINGCMVSGFGSASKFAAYPSYLHQMLLSGPSQLLEAQLFKSLETLDFNNVKSCVRFIEQLRIVVQKEGEVILKLLGTLRWDFLFYVISPLDWFQHAFMDKIVRLTTQIGSKHSLELEIMEEALIDFYKSVDFLIGRFLKLVEQTSDDFMFFIVSDHGFTIRPYVFNLARWLIRNRYMKVHEHTERRHERSLISTFVLKASDLSKSKVSGQILEDVLKVLPGNALRKLKRTYFRARYKTGVSEYTDLNSSKIFCLEDHGIYINPLVKDTKILDKMIHDLNDYLKQFPDLVLKTFRRNEIYWGDKVELSPDLIIRILDKDQIWDTSTDPTKPLIFKTSLPGIHDDYGIFLAYGSNIKRGAPLKKTVVWDICPTILHIFNVPIPSNIDGRVLKEIFKGELAQQPTKRQISEKERIKKKVQALRESLHD